MTVNGRIIAAAALATFNALYTIWLYFEVNHLAEYCFAYGPEPWPGCLEAGGRLEYNAVFLLPFLVNAIFAIAALIRVVTRRREHLNEPM